MTTTFAYNPDQERDEKGRWVPSGDKAAGVLDGQADSGALTPFQGPDNASIQSAGTADSLTSHLGPDGKVDPERAALHEKIIAQMTEGVPPAAPGERVSYMMGGGPAAGKSSIMNDPALGIPGEGEAVFVDPDSVKQELPEYQQMTAAGDKGAAAYVHEESSMVSKQVMAAAVSNNQSVVLDGTGDSSYQKLESKVEKLREGGGTVVAHYVTCDPDTAVARVQDRAEKTGRLVPESVVRGTHASVAEVLPQAMEKGLFDEVTLWDTNTPQPTKIAEAKGTEITIHDQAAWEKFKGYAA